jgi:hypothetical protein
VPVEVAGSDPQQDVAQALLLVFGRRRPEHGVDGQGPPGRQVGVAHRPVVVVVGVLVLVVIGVAAVLVPVVLEVRLVLLPAGQRSLCCPTTCIVVGEVMV